MMSPQTRARLALSALAGRMLLEGRSVNVRVFRMLLARALADRDPSFAHEVLPPFALLTDAQANLALDIIENELPRTFLRPFP